MELPLYDAKMNSCSGNVFLVDKQSRQEFRPETTDWPEHILEISLGDEVRGVSHHNAFTISARPIAVYGHGADTFSFDLTSCCVRPVNETVFELHKIDGHSYFIDCVSETNRRNWMIAIKMTRKMAFKHLIQCLPKCKASSTSPTDPPSPITIAAPITGDDSHSSKEHDGITVRDRDTTTQDASTVEVEFPTGHHDENGTTSEHQQSTEEEFAYDSVLNSPFGAIEPTNASASGSASDSNGDVNLGESGSGSVPHLRLSHMVHSETPHATADTEVTTTTSDHGNVKKVQEKSTANVPAGAERENGKALTTVRKGLPMRMALMYLSVSGIVMAWMTLLVYMLFTLARQIVEGRLSME